MNLRNCCIFEAESEVEISAVIHNNNSLLSE